MNINVEDDDATLSTLIHGRISRADMMAAFNSVYFTASVANRIAEKVAEHLFVKLAPAIDAAIKSELGSTDKP